MENRTSVLIGHTIFFTSEKLSYQHFDWLYQYTVLLTREENPIVMLFTTWPPCWDSELKIGKGRKSYLAFMSEKKKYLNGMNLFWEFDIMFRHCSPLTGFQCQNNLYLFGINKLLHGWFVCTIFIMRLS